MITAPERSFKAPAGADEALESTFDRAEQLIHSGHVQEAAEQFALVAKLADEPLRSRAMLKFGYASSILSRPGAKSALASAALTTVAGSEGREIRSFARKMLQKSADVPILLMAPPRGIPTVPRKSTVTHSRKALWNEIDEIEILRQKGRVSVAMMRYRMLLSEYPDHPVILNNMALLMTDVGDSEAEMMVRRAFSAPGAEEYIDFLYDTLGFTLLKQGKAVESIDHFRRSLAMRETAERDMHMAMALETIGQPDVAEQFRERARALDISGQVPTAE